MPAQDGAGRFAWSRDIMGKIVLRDSLAAQFAKTHAKDIGLRGD